MTYDPFGARQEFSPRPGQRGIYYSLPALEKAGLGSVSRLPASLRIVLESVLRNADGKRIREEDVRALAGWKPAADNNGTHSRVSPTSRESYRDAY